MRWWLSALLVLTSCWREPEPLPEVEHAYAVSLDRFRTAVPGSPWTACWLVEPVGEPVVVRISGGAIRLMGVEVDRYVGESAVQARGNVVIPLHDRLLDLGEAHFDARNRHACVREFLRLRARGR